MKLKDRIASGLRAMKKEPDYFIFLDGEDWTYDNEFILGIKVIHVEGVTCSFETGCIFMPAWNHEYSESLVDTGRFFKGYNDC